MHVGMLLIVLCACLLRLFLISQEWPNSNSDEAIIDLMALHIYQGKEFPIFFYGQGYMGAIQAYIGSLLFHILGVSILSVRVGLVVLYAGFLVGLYAWTNVLYSRKFALFVITLLSLGSTGTIAIQIFANGGYVETMLFAVLIMLTAAKIVFSSPVPGQTSSTSSRRRVVAYAVLGLLTGLAMYSHLLIMPTIVTTAMLLWLFCRHELRSRLGWALGLGFFVGFLPLIVYNITAPANMDSIHALAGSTGFGASREGVSFLQQITQAFVITLPNATGVSPICWVQEPVHPVGSILELFTRQSPLECTLRGSVWALGYTVLWISSCVLVARPLWKRWRQQPMADWTYDERQHAIRSTIHVLLLISVLLSFTLYSLGLPAALHPRSTARYLVCMSLATPALLWPFWSMWSGFRTIPQQSAVSERWKLWVGNIIRGSICAGLLLVLLWGTLNIKGELPPTQGAFKQQRGLVQTLRSMDVTLFYSEYWTCNRLIFISQEKLICASLDEELEKGVNRYSPYWDIVQAEKRPLPYVFRANSTFDKALQQRLAQDSGVRYERKLIVNEYVIYMPVTSP